MFQTKGLEEIKTLILHSITPPSHCRAVYEIRKNMVEPGKRGGDNIIWRMRCACWISKAKGTP